VFCTHGTVPTEAMRLTVEGLRSPVGLPIRAPGAKQLISVAQPAVFGRRDQTVLDTDVRDTWVVALDQVSFGERWGSELERVLDQVRDDFGLPASSRFEARPHSLLVYGKGQFFAPHQDSEKHDTMVATLVVVLPSLHTGGELVVDHGGTPKTFCGSRDEIRYVAFYSDCRHEVTPVRSGYRATLTFDLLLTEEPTEVLGPVDEAASLLTEHFTSPGVRWGREVDPPVRLVFLLDHEYSQRGLERGRLKGADVERVAVLQAAAEQAGYRTALAAAEIQEVWDAYPSPPAGRYWDRYDYWDDGTDDVEDDEYELNEIVDNATVLGWWALGGGEEINLALGDEEVCAVTETRNLTPYESTFEGYTGNAGNTVDRWYRRAALVVWPDRHEFAVRAQVTPQWALEQVGEALTAGRLDQARDQAAQAAPFWGGLPPERLALALDVAHGLDEPDAATRLLRAFGLGAYMPHHASAAARVAGCYGHDWADALVALQVAGPKYAPASPRLVWITNTFPAWCRALRQVGADRLAASYESNIWGSVLADLVAVVSRGGPRDKRLQVLAEHTAHIAAIAEVADHDMCVTIATDLRGLDDDLLAAVVPALCAPAVRENPAVSDLVDQMCARAEAVAARPLRAVEDWSIPWSGCGCDLCAHLETFLRSGSVREDWPLRKDRRQHVHQQIDHADLPVTHQTRRQGSPFTLVLTKTRELFDRETRDRDTALVHLSALHDAYPTANTS